jgi:hypothetical protein
MILGSDTVRRILELRRTVRLTDARPNDGRCGPVAAAIETELGWQRECGYLRLLDGSVSWVHCWNRMDTGVIVDATADQFGDLWLGGVAVLAADHELIDRYLPDPADWALIPQGPAARPEGLLCQSGDESRLIRADDLGRPWSYLTRESLRLVTGWSLGNRQIDLAARALRAKLTSEGEVSTATLIRPLVTQSILHLGGQGLEPWVAVEFQEPI